jgi:hypothetical protein
MFAMVLEYCIYVQYNPLAVVSLTFARLPHGGRAFFLWCGQIAKIDVWCSRVYAATISLRLVLHSERMEWKTVPISG